MDKIIWAVSAAEREQDVRHGEAKRDIERSFHPELRTSEHRKLLTWGLESVKDSLLSSKIISANQLNDTIISVKKLETDLNRKVFYYKMFQIVARKKN